MALSPNASETVADAMDISRAVCSMCQMRLVILSDDFRFMFPSLPYSFWSGFIMTDQYGSSCNFCDSGCEVAAEIRTCTFGAGAMRV